MMMAVVVGTSVVAPGTVVELKRWLVGSDYLAGLAQANHVFFSRLA